MNKTAVQVFRIFSTARNIRKLSCSTAWTCYSRTAALPYSSNSNSKNNSLTSVPLPVAGGDETVQSLVRAKTSKELLTIVKKDYQLWKSYHWYNAFKMIHYLHKSNKDDSSEMNKSELIQLCELFEKVIKHTSPDDAVYILRILNDLQVPTTSIIMQSLLQLIRMSLNHLRFTSLTTLDHLLGKLQNTPLSNALSIAVPIICEIQIKNKQLDTNSIWQLANALYYLKSNSTNGKSVAMIMSALKKHGQTMSNEQAKLIFDRMCNLYYLPPGYEEVLANVNKVLSDSMALMGYEDIVLILKNITKKAAFDKSIPFYNEELVDACAKLVISKDFGFEKGSNVLRFLNTLSHTHLRLIDYLAVKCFEDPSVLQGCYYNMVTGLSGADYKPIFWESIQEIVLKEKKKDNSTNRSSMAIRFAVGLAVFDCFDQKVTEEAFSMYNLEWTQLSTKSHMQWHYLLFYQSVKIFYPSYPGPWPSENKIQTVIDNVSAVSKNSSLLPTLENAMGGTEYVLSNLKSRLGHRIDHVVIMRKGGYPVAANVLTNEARENSHVYIEDLKLPAGSQVIIILDIPVTAYAQNSRRLKGAWNLLIRTMEAHTGHSVIPISSIVWDELMARERTPYLMQAIRLKFDDPLESISA